MRAPTILRVAGRRRNGSRGVTVAAALAVSALIMGGVAMPAQAAATLKASAEAKGRYFGTALTRGDLGISGEINLAAAQFDMVTPGNEMKWDATEPSRGSFNFVSGDQIVSFAQSHGMRVRGHNLVWHSQLPAWVSSLPLNQVQAAMENHISNVATHYRGKLYAWDVINEPFEENGSLRQDVFYRAMGAGYLATALRAARAADPNAKLYINDYNIEGINAKSNGLYSLAQSLLAQGAPLDGIGFESHFIVGQVPSSLQANMQRFADLGLDVAVTELDDRIQMPADSSELQQQGRDYGAVVSACLAVSRCVGISQWGVDDGHTWIPGTFPGYGAPMMWDAGYQPKPAYTAALSALGGSPSPSPSPSPTPTPTSPGTAGAIRAVGAGRCLDVPNSSTTNGTQVQLWDCNTNAGQRWTVTSSKQIQVYGNKCLDANGRGTANGTQVIIWDCNGQTNQQWNVNSNGTITGVQSGLCLDANGAGTANGTKIILWSCNGQANQRWTVG
ncbi:endo-1,4-beta-xylanase [Microbispora sp. NPDC049125]|uniref:endo-1,4-beta-xylanase n=1 Tax=Microbispora sp. NPDC049125 TaxID=3154929 RepID=UPI003465732A